MAVEVQDTLKFLVTAHTDLVLVRWLEPLGNPTSRPYRVLEAELLNIVGVESVKLHRYSASLAIAPHVTTPQAVVDEVIKLFTEDGEILDALRFQFHPRHVEVFAAAHVVKLS